MQIPLCVSNRPNTFASQSSACQLDLLPTRTVEYPSNPPPCPQLKDPCYSTYTLKEEKSLKGQFWLSVEATCLPPLLISEQRRPSVRNIPSVCGMLLTAPRCTAVFCSQRPPLFRQNI